MNLDEITKKDEIIQTDDLIGERDMVIGKDIQKALIMTDIASLKHTETEDIRTENLIGRIGERVVPNLQDEEMRITTRKENLKERVTKIAQIL